MDATKAIVLGTVFLAVVALLVCGGCAGRTSSASAPSPTAVGDDDASPADSVDAALRRGLDFLRSQQTADGYWMGSFVTDTSYTADYILLMNYLGQVDEARQAKAAAYIVQQQQADGGWAEYPGGPSVIDIAVDDYLALKLAGRPADDATMTRARTFILAHGGGEAASVLIKTKLAYFRQVPWGSMIPLNTDIMAAPKLPYELGYFHSVLIPFTMIYENYRAVNPPAGRDIHEIFLADPWRGVHETPPPKGCCADEALAWILERQEADGNWAGVFVNTMFSLIALNSTGDPAYGDRIQRGLAGVELFQNVAPDTIDQQFSQPPVMDTAYVLHLLLAAGAPATDPDVARAATWLASKQSSIYGDWSVLNPGGKPGGWGFELHNRYFPDVDCTAMAVDAFAQMDGPHRFAFRDSIGKGVAWMISMQDRDDGWPAWDKNAIDPHKLFPALHDALWLPADMSDADITARVILALADLDAAAYRDEIAQGVAFLKAQQGAPGYWYGRWGVNYTYGTGQALQGLIAAGEPSDAPYIRRAVAWLKSVQNPDGGWGESPASYLDPNDIGVGPSTVFQTAYVLIGLIAAGAAETPEVAKGVAWLIAAQHDDGSWRDEQFLGCTLPGYNYSRYDLLSTYKSAYALLLYDKARTAP
jgi:squalene-hopene/tetraprenyl-beta-curcumene cyclase